MTKLKGYQRALDQSRDIAKAKSHHRGSSACRELRSVPGESSIGDLVALRDAKLMEGRDDLRVEGPGAA